MNWRLIGYALACVVAPVAWGLLVVWASNWLERLLRKRHPSDTILPEEMRLPPVDYHI